jgi:TDG/mug DNA glycosylase family protein
VDAATVAIYERGAARYRASRPIRDGERAAAFAATCLPGLPIADLGCGPGGYLAHLRSAGHPVVAYDAAAAMLDLCGPGPRVRADLEALCFRDRSLGGAWARHSYHHLPRTRLPLALARLHWACAPGAPVALGFPRRRPGNGAEDRSDDPEFPGRLVSRWEARELADLCVGAGFCGIRIEEADDVVWVTAVRAQSLPDTVGPGMRVLVCGLNPSVAAARAGVGFFRPGNRFWPAARAAGLVRADRDPLRALRDDGVGMTDLVKRASPTAAGITAAEYRAGAARVERLVRWLEPGVVLFVGLAGYRAAVDRHAVAGPQPPFGGRPAYVMPSTSGANAATPFDVLVAHMVRARALADG